MAPTTHAQSRSSVYGITQKKFAPRPDKNETIDTYLNFIYGEGNENDEITDDDDTDIPTAGTRQQWQHAHWQFHQRMSTRG